MQKWKKVLAVAIAATTIGGGATAALAGREGPRQPDQAIEREVPGRETEQRGPEAELRGRANEPGEDRRHEGEAEEAEAENEADEEGADDDRGPSSNSGPGSHHGENEDRGHENGEFGTDG
jgi:hypothetical protein